MVVFGKKWFYSDKVVVLGKSGCIRAEWLYSGKVVVFGQKWLYSGKSGCIRSKSLYSGKLGFFGQSGCKKWLYSGQSGKSGCIRTKWLYSGKNSEKLVLFEVVVFGKGCCIWAKVVVFVFGQKWYSGKLIAIQSGG